MNDNKESTTYDLEEKVQLKIKPICLRGLADNTELMLIEKADESKEKSIIKDEKTIIEDTQKSEHEEIEEMLKRFSNGVDTRLYHDSDDSLSDQSTTSDNSFEDIRVRKKAKSRSRGKKQSNSITFLSKKRKMNT